MATQLPQPSDFSKVLEQAFNDLAAGNVAQAEPVLRDALRFLPEETTVNNYCMVKLGEICTERGDYSDAIRLNLRLLDQLKRRLGETNEAVIESMEQIAILYENSGRFEEAEYMHQRARALSQKLVTAELSPEQEGSLEALAEEPEINLGAEPAWLAQAFDDAAQAYGKTDKEKKTAERSIEIEIESPKPTAYFSRPEEQTEERPASSGVFERQAAKKNDDTPSPAQSSGNYSRPKESNKETKKENPDALPKEDSGINVGGISLHWQGKQERYKTDPKIDISELEALIEKVSSGRMPVFRPEEYTPPPRTERKSESCDKKDKSHEKVVVKHESVETTSGQIDQAFFQKQDNKIESANPGLDMLFRLGKQLGVGQSKKIDQHDNAPFGFGLFSGGSDSPHKHLREVPQTKLREAPRVSLEQSQIAVMVGHVAHWFVQTVRTLREPNKLLKAIVASVLAIGLLFIACDWLIPRNPTPAQVLTEIPLAYRTADGNLQLRLVDATTSQVKVLDKITRPRYSFFLADWRDYIALPFSALVQKQHWLMRSGAGLKCEEGPTLYYIGSPEVQLADYMEHLADESSAHFGLTGEYPAKLEDFVAQRIAFRNPFTGKQETPFIQRLYYGNDSEKETLLTALKEGLPWRGEPDPHEGSIHCCSVTFKTVSGLDKLFFLRAYDRELEPLGGSSPNTSHFLLLENGERSSESTDRLLFQNWSFRPEVFWLLEKGDNPITLFFLTYALSILFAMITLIFLCIYKIAQPEKRAKIFVVLTIKLSAVLAVLLIFVRMIP